jgi:hypothetical protein
MADLGKAYVQIIPKAEGISEKIKESVSPGAGKAGTSAGNSFVGTFAKIAGGAAVGAAVFNGMKAAIDEGAKLQQSYGGLDTLYGEASAAAKDYAMEAAKAGISANDYAEQAVSFGASLKAAFGGDTEAAVEAANTAIMDMADNAAKMGTPIESIQAAYQGFAKGQYQLLDNLKLGYGGTKSEMERLLKDASELSGKEYNIDNLGDVYDAIHVIQEDLGLTGVAAEEAATTFSGSFGAMKASAQNVLAMLSTGGDVGPAMAQLASAAGTFLFDNLVPMVGNVISAIPGLIGTFIQEGAPTLIEQGRTLLTNLIEGLITGIPEMANTAAEMIRGFADGFGEGSEGAAEFITKAGELMTSFGSAILDAAGILIPAAIDAIWAFFTETDWIGLGTSVVQMLIDAFNTMFPKAVEIVKSTVKDIATRLGFTGLAAKVKRVFDSVKEKITSPINKAKDLVSSAIEKIKGFFPISIGKILDNIKLPHFSVDGGEFPYGVGGKGHMPSFGVEWYARGGIMTRPTLFGGGEAGAEGIVPLDPFWDRMDKMVDSIVDGVSSVVGGAAGMGGDVYVTLYAYPGGPQMDQVIVRSYDRGKRNGLK